MAEPSCAACSLPFFMGVDEFLCKGVGCLSPQYHASCISPGSAMCDTCVASGAPLSTALLEPDLQPIVESSGLAEDDHRALIGRSHVSVHNVHHLLGVPRSISCFKPIVESTELRLLVKTIARVLREHNSVSEDFMNLLQVYKDAGWGDPEAVKDKTGKLVQMNCPFFTPHMEEACYLDANLGDETVITDDSFNLVGNISAVNVFACMAPVVSAGGATMPIMIMLYLTGSGIEGDMAHALSRARKFLFKKRMGLYEQRAAAHAVYKARGDISLRPPPPQPPFPPQEIPMVQFFDKSASSFRHAVDNAKSLAASDDGRAATTAVRVELKAAYASDASIAASPIDAASIAAASIAAAAELFAKLPGVNSDGSVRAFDVVPPSPDELAQKFPEAFPAVTVRSAAENRSRFGNIFTAPVVDMYGAILDGLAHVVEEELGKGVEKLLAAEHSGDVNEAAAQLLPVYYVLARGSTAADTLARYHLHFTLLCDFHVWKAIERKISCLDGDKRGPVLDAVRDVICKGESWAAFKERFKDQLSTVTVSLDSSEKSVGDDGARVGIFEYFEKHWLSRRWRSTVDGKFRALIEKYGINTTNDVELFWNTLKNNWMHGLRRNPALALALILGKPRGVGVAAAADSDNSYLAQRWHDIKSFTEGKSRLMPRASRDTMALSVSSLLLRAAADPSLIADNSDGSFTIGNQTAGFVFKERADFVRNVRSMNSQQLLGLSFAVRATSVSDKVLAKGCGRNKEQVKAAMSAAQSAARDDNSALFTRADQVNALLERVHVNKQRPTEFEALSARAVSYAQLQRAAAACHPNFVDGLLALVRKQDMAADEDAIDLVEGNQALRDVLLSPWALLERADFSGAIPHVALIYVILLTMTARQWLDEYERVIVTGERVSLIFGDDLPLGYRIALVRTAHVAKTAKPDDKLTDVYIGQEHRGNKSKGLYGRAKQHTTFYGSHNICQLQFVTSKREGFIVTPAGDVTVERRLVAMLPAGEDAKKLVNAAEALVFLFCELVKGFIALNDSPPGELRRLLKSNWAGPPRIVALCSNLLNAIGGEERARKVRLRDVVDKAGPFLRDALACVHLLMENGHFVDVDGTALPADFRDGGCTELSKFSVLTLVTALVESVDDDGGIGGAPSKVYTTVPWCNACTCPYVGPLCKHLIVARILVLVRKLVPTWHGNSEALYWRDGPAATYSHRITSAPMAERSKAADADAAARAAADIPAQVAQLAYHTALTLQRAAEGDETVDVVALSEFLKSMNSRMIKFSGAALLAGGARGGPLGSHRKAARSANDINRDRAEGVSLHASLSPSETLARLSRTHPLSAGPLREAALSAAPSEASAAWCAAAHAALSTSARNVAAAFAARAAIGSGGGRGDCSSGSGRGDGSSGGVGIEAAGAGGGAVTNDAPCSDDEAECRGAGIVAGAGAGTRANLRTGGKERKGAAAGGPKSRKRPHAAGAPLSAGEGGDAADECAGAPTKRAAPDEVDASADASPNAAAAATAVASDSEMCGVDAKAVRQPPIPGLRTRSTTVRRGELGLLMPDVKGSVIADADTA